VDFSLIPQGIVSGLLLGCIYALVATGLTMIFGVMRVLNLAHGEFVMLGMYLAYGIVVATGMDPYLSWVVTIPALGLLGAAVYAGLVGPVLRRGDENSPIVLTVGLLLVLQNLVVFFLTGNVRGLSSAYQFMSIKLAPIVIVSVPLLIGAIGSVVATVLLFLFLRRTEMGLALRAVAARPGSAPLVGINVQHVFIVAFSISSGCAGLAATLLVPAYPFSPITGGQYTLTALLVVILGGLGNYAGALVGALILGVTQSVAVLYLSDGVASSVVLCMVIAVLLLRPQGLFSTGAVRA
jgi:branched-chain amino acid transport system permease protein